ncbi:conserved hypothetical protein [Vibrio chagasii]|nr:conserved hypothetical protein [Vibrio chagasii]CAH7225717.1 conserved hypothetical protein [Vibrio chagasii]CAH7413700.1 conserved hypothetical protein [Vibrio chagasii]
MINLSKEQLTLLAWMKRGHTFEVCSDYCPRNGEVLPKERLPIRLFKETIDKLFQAGLITYVSNKSYGLRWDVFSLTQKGSERV